MAAPVETNVRRAVGRLCIDPTGSLADPTDYPFGTGTALGLVTQVRLVTESREFVIRAEEYGGEATEVVHLGRDLTVFCMVHGWDDDTHNTIWTNTAAGGTSGNVVITEPGGKDPGTLLSGNAVKLLFTPFESNHPGFLVYRAIPNLAASTRLNFGLELKLGYLAVFRALRDGSERVAQIGQLEDLTL